MYVSLGDDNKNEKHLPILLKLTRATSLDKTRKITLLLCFTDDFRGGKIGSQ